MKTKKILISTFLLLGLTKLQAQSHNGQVTLRIKTVENINGVETVSDTTFVTDQKDMHRYHPNLQHHPGGKMMIKKGDVDQKFSDMELKKLLSEEEFEQMTSKEAGNSGKTFKKIIIHEENHEEGPHKNGEKKMCTKIMVRTLLADPDQKELQKAGIVENKNKLALESLNFSRNPSSGKFNINFTSAAKGDLNVLVKDLQGRSLFSDSVKNFSGDYHHEINLGEVNKGIYLITISQNDKLLTKKLVVD
jgi:hypothetical protein